MALVIASIAEATPFVHAKASDDGEQTASDVGVKISTPQFSIKSGAAIPISAAVTNKLRKPVPVENDYAPHGEYSMKVVFEGHELPLVGDAPNAEDDPKKRKLGVIYPGAGFIARNLLAPGQSLSFQFNLGQYFILTKPGIYEVSLTLQGNTVQDTGEEIPCAGSLAGYTSCGRTRFGSESSEFHAKSNELTITVTP
jgi:hypothetical protein